MYWYLANAGVCFCLIFAGTIATFKGNNIKKILKNQPTVRDCYLQCVGCLVPPNDLIYLDPWRVLLLAYMAGNRLLTFTEVHLFVPDRLWCYTDSVVSSCRLACTVPARPAARQCFSFKWGAAGWGEHSDEYTGTTGHSGHVEYTLVIRILSTPHA